MPEVKRSVLVGYTPAQMFDLVDAVERYPEFLPWCGGATVSRRDAATTRATILIHFRGIRQSFTTENTKQAPREIIMQLVEGPFSKLDGSWRFTELADCGSKVELDLRYEFSSRLIEKMIGPVFGHIAGTLLDAFVGRARKIYD